MNTVTIVLCTYAENRLTTLRRAVNVTLKQISINDELILVVDHNEPLLALCRQEFNNCIVIPNRHSRGLSGARNTALDAAQGSIIVFLDDDAVPLDGWLEELRAPFSDAHVYGVGGLAKPYWCAGRPGWFPDEFLWVVGCSYRGLPSDSQPVRGLIGANMSFRRAAFESVGVFAETMGRVGDGLLGSEETEFSIRLARAIPDAKLLYNPAARVEHYVPSRRRSIRYFARRCWAEGISKAEVTRRVGRLSALSAERDYTARVLPSGIWQGVRDGFSGDLWGIGRSGAITFGFFVTAAGYCVGSLRLAPSQRR